jgi:hypothetical protein
MLRHVSQTFAKTLQVGFEETLPQLLQDTQQGVHQGAQPSEKNSSAECAAEPKHLATAVWIMIGHPIREIFLHERKGPSNSEDFTALR